MKRKLLLLTILLMIVNIANSYGVYLYVVDPKDIEQNGSYYTYHGYDDWFWVPLGFWGMMGWDMEVSTSWRHRAPETKLNFYYHVGGKDPATTYRDREGPRTLEEHGFEFVSFKLGTFWSDYSYKPPIGKYILVIEDSAGDTKWL